MEPLKLFCENDQRLVCLICKEGEKHGGHSFKPVKEAMEISEKVVREALRFILHDNKQMGDMILSQMLEMTKSMERAKRLEEKMHAQFNKMHDFLRKKEEEMVRQLRRQASSAKLQINGSNQEFILESGLQMSQPERFLEWWSEKGFPLVDAISLSENKDIKSALPTK
ncbi:hypothetical protein G5714_016183 [Onychostoma macrolepis]|uniref:B box-type domain-containing protein n=1 Tax=Onychostoma macrolepis TaxID=369639 RepID=A0A7J6C7R9_9TELE|nr:hypothetical protein G5714_016183 [Onychostoma macrolepis]